jgi:hypothetical protein
MAIAFIMFVTKNFNEEFKHTKVYRFLVFADTNKSWLLFSRSLGGFICYARDALFLNDITMFTEILRVSISGRTEKLVGPVNRSDWPILRWLLMPSGRR